LACPGFYAVCVPEREANQGLLVCREGFESSVERKRASQLFRVRLWYRSDPIEQILGQSDELDDDIRAELQLKRIWTVAHATDTNA
jgi:restriction system protein